MHVGPSIEAEHVFSQIHFFRSSIEAEQHHYDVLQICNRSFFVPETFRFCSNKLGYMQIYNALKQNCSKMFNEYV